MMQATGDLPGGVAPIHVFLTLLALGLTIVGQLWRMTHALTEMQLKISLMWKEYERRLGINSGPKS